MFELPLVCLENNSSIQIGKKELAQIYAFRIIAKIGENVRKRKNPDKTIWFRKALIFHFRYINIIF